MFFNIDVPQETTASAHRRALFRDMGSRNRKAPLSPCLGAVWSGATGSFRFGVPPTEGQRWVGFRPGQRAELVEVSRTPVAFPPPDDLSRADHAGGERITTRFSALLMHVEGVRPEQTEKPNGQCSRLILIELMSEHPINDRCSSWRFQCGLGLGITGWATK